MLRTGDRERKKAREKSTRDERESGVESERTGARKTNQIESVRGRGEAATGSVDSREVKFGGGDFANSR